MTFNEDVWLGAGLGFGIGIALILAVWAIVDEILDRRERRATDWKRKREQVARTRPPRHSKVHNMEGTQRLWPTSITESSVNLLADQDQARVRPLKRPETLADAQEIVAGHDDRPAIEPPPWPYAPPRDRRHG